jgi:hypothetical protein
MKKSRAKLIKIYLVPIITLVVFVGIIVFMIIPKISEIFSSLGKINADNEQIAVLNALDADLSGLEKNKGAIETDLVDLNTIASGGTTRVVEFRDKIAGILTSFGLDIESQNISESSFITTDVDSSIILIEIPFTFSVTGSLDDTKAFINSLSTIDDFAIVKELDIKKGTTEAWLMNIILIKYQFGTNPEAETLYQNVDIHTIVPDNIRGYLDSRE